MTQQSPCRTCPGLHLDKNNEVCLNCPARLAYMRGAPPVGYPADIIDEIANQEKMEMEMETKIPVTIDDAADADAPIVGAGHAREITPAMKICSKCEKPKPATTDHFYPNKMSPDKLDYECIVCKKDRADTAYDKIRKKPKKIKTLSKDPVKRTTIPAPVGAGHARETGPTLTIDFTEHPEILAGLQERAKKSFRTINGQALYVLHTACCCSGQ